MSFLFFKTDLVLVCGALSARVGASAGARYYETAPAQSQGAMR
jgi:hypothetical protein